jgi:hypothetical protein
MVQESLRVSGWLQGIASRWVLTQLRVGGELPGAALATQGASQAGGARGGDRGGADTGCTCAQRSSRSGGLCVCGGVLLVQQRGCREGWKAPGLDRTQLITHLWGARWRVAGSQIVETGMSCHSVYKSYNEPRCYWRAHIVRDSSVRVPI